MFYELLIALDILLVTAYFMKFSAVCFTVDISYIAFNLIFGMRTPPSEVTVPYAYARYVASINAFLLLLYRGDGIMLTCAMTLVFTTLFLSVDSRSRLKKEIPEARIEKVDGGRLFIYIPLTINKKTYEVALPYSETDAKRTEDMSALLEKDSVKKSYRHPPGIGFYVTASDLKLEKVSVIVDGDVKEFTGDTPILA